MVSQCPSSVPRPRCRLPPPACRLALTSFRSSTPATPPTSLVLLPCPRLASRLRREPSRSRPRLPPQPQHRVISPTRSPLQRRPWEDSTPRSALRALGAFPPVQLAS